MARDLTVVIPTYNRKQRLARVLAALERQSIGAERFEVVVVDDGSTDGTTEWLTNQRTPYALNPLRQDNSGPAIARNTGVEAASSDLVLFLDDDVEPTPDLLKEHLQSHRAESADLVVIGTLSSLPSYAQPWVAWEQAKVEKQYADMMRGRYEPTFRQFWTGNASVAKRHVVAAGMFNPAFLRAEDVELGYRLDALGLEFRFNPLARGYHHAERSLDSWMLAHRSYGRLEVEIFGRRGPSGATELLADNWSRVHPTLRPLIRASVVNRARHRAVVGLLRSWLLSPLATRAPKMSERACSVLANLLYWEAAGTALGEDARARMFVRGEEIIRKLARERAERGRTAAARQA